MTALIELHEFKLLEVANTVLAREAAELLRKEYGEYIIVEATSFLPGSTWRIESQGYVGFIPLTPEVGFRLLPKQGVTISNIFRMLEYAYDLKSFRFLPDLMDCSCLEDLYERLAEILARLVLERGRRGFHRDYQPRSDRFSCVRGRLDLRSACLKPWNAQPLCHFEENTSDIEENRILAWTLRQILHSGICTERSLLTVRQAYRSLINFATLRPFPSSSCTGRTYTRLNQDYEPLMALCRFFLEHRGPGHEAGEHRMIPFLVNMSRLYELFVARWLQANLSQGLSLQIQEQVIIDRGRNMKLVIDLVLYDDLSGQPLAVMDTKYKAAPPSTTDVAQAVAYAKSKGCRMAILIYPREDESKMPLLATVGSDNNRPNNSDNNSSAEGDDSITVRSATFALSDDVDEAGRKFLKQIGLGSASSLP